MLGLLYSLALLWAIIYAVNKRQRGKPSGLPLPAYSTPRAQAAKYQIRLRPLHLIVETTALNQTHDKFAWTLLRNPTLKSVLKSFYGLGGVLGVTGMLGGVGMLVWTIWKLSYMLLAFPPAGGRLAKRDATTSSPQGSELPFYLIVSWSLLPMTGGCNYIGTWYHHPSPRPPSPSILALFQFVFPRIWTRCGRSSVSRSNSRFPVTKFRLQGQCSFDFSRGIPTRISTIRVCLHLFRNHVTTTCHWEVTHSLGRCPS